MLNNAKYVAQ